MDLIRDKGYYWENMYEDILDYIQYECETCINRISGEKLNVKNKILITKDSKERFVFDGFQLDDISKEIKGYSYIIKIKKFI